MNLTAMRAALADVDEYLQGALDQIGEMHDPALTPARAARLEGTTTAYLQLAGDALQRFQEAARGA